MQWLALILVGACGGGFDSQITVSPGSATAFTVDDGPAQSGDFEIDDSFDSYTVAHQHQYKLLFILPSGSATQTFVVPHCGTRNHYDTGIAKYSLDLDGVLTGSGACSDSDGASCHWSESSDNC